MDILHAILLGIVEGVTEFLPVSSTGHLILAAQLMGLAQTDFQKMFEVVIQLGAILAVVALYWREFLNLAVLKRIIVAFIPTGVIGLALYKAVKALEGSETVVLWALFLGGVALIVFEWLHREGDDAHEELATLPYKTAALIGVFQAIAIIPGVSRSAATIVGGLLLGMKRAAIVRFSFLLAVPTMLAASALDLYKNIGDLGGSGAGVLAAGFVAAFVVAMPSVAWLLRYVRTHTFVPFGLYRIVLAGAFFIAVPGLVFASTHVGLQLPLSVPSLVNAPLNITLNFTDPVPGFNPASTTLLNASISNFTAAADNETFLMTLVPAADGAFSLSLPAGTVGDNNVAFSVGSVYDATPPQVFLFSTSSSPTSQAILSSRRRAKRSPASHHRA
jgi:undecaprenyl-diphosphatase